MKGDTIDDGSRLNRKTPRKTSVDSSYRNKFCEKLRSNSSFKKRLVREDDCSTSPKAFRDRSVSRPGKSVGRLMDRSVARSKNKEFDFIELTRKNTKNSDKVHTSKHAKIEDQDTEHDYHSQMTKSYVLKTSTGFESKDTLSNCKSSVSSLYSRPNHFLIQRESNKRPDLSM